MGAPLVSRSIEVRDLLTEQYAGTDRYVDTGGGADANDGLSYETAYKTIQAAHDAAVAGDRILIAPGDYEEKLTITKNNLTLIGRGGRGSVSIAPTGANDTAITIQGTAAARTSNVTLVNIGGEGAGTGGGLHVKGNIRRIRAVACKFEGGAFACKLESTAAGAVGDTRFEDCEFAWATRGIHFAVSGAGDPVTQTYVRECLLHNIVTASIFVDTTHSTDLWVEDCFFGNQEDGTAPTDYVLASVASTTGFFSGNRFATATNAAAVLTIAAGVIWAANATEAGYSAARPV